MENVTDTEAVKAWIDRALKHLSATGPAGGAPMTLSAIADRLNVKPQAISGWKRTGRIRKSNLAELARLSGVAPPFALPVYAVLKPAEHTTVSERHAGEWPFQRVTPSDWRRLPQTQRDMVESLILVELQRAPADVGNAA